MKKLLYALVAFTIFITGMSLIKNNHSIIIYSSMEQFRNDEMQKQLNEKFPELRIHIVQVPTAKAAAKLRFDGMDTEADIVVGLEIAYMESIKKNMAEVKQYSHLDYMEDAEPETKKYLIWERQAGSIIVNRSVLERENLPMPATFEDLLNPIYKNMIVVPDPKSSGTGYFFLKNLVNSMGEGKAFAYVDALAPNVRQFTESGAGPIQSLVQGEAAIGFGLTFQGVNEINNGNDLLLLEPEFGSPYSLTATSMVEGRQNDPDIVKVFEFIVNDYMLYDKMHGSPEKVLQDQVNYVENYPNDIQYADMDGINDIKEKERLLARWKY